LHLPSEGRTTGGPGLIQRQKNRVNPSTDEHLVRRLKGGDENAFGEIYFAYRSRIYRFALKLLRDGDQAEDITQEAFIKARKAIHSLNQSQSLLSWLLTITRNEVFSHFRKTEMNGSLDQDDVWDTDTPLDHMIIAEATEAVQAAVAQLSPPYREVILLREYEQLSYAEIAQVTGDTEAAVKMRLFKARKALVKKLRPYVGD